jgi:hypothetical protein
MSLLTAKNNGKQEKISTPENNTSCTGDQVLEYLKMPSKRHVIGSTKNEPNIFG